MTMTFEPVQLISFLVGIGLPLLVALVTKDVTSGKLKSILLAALSLLTSFLTELLHSMIAGTPFLFWSVIYGLIGTFVVGGTLHTNLYKPTGATAALQAVGSTPKAQ